MGEGGLVDEGTAACVDEDGGGFHEAEGVGVDDVAGLGGEWAVEADNVGLAEEVVEVGGLADAEGVELLGALAGVGKDVHAEGGGDACYGAACVAEAYDADGHAVEFLEVGAVEGEVGACLPFALDDELAVLLGLVDDVEEVGKDALCNAHGAVGWHVGDNDTATVCGIDVYDVVACGYNAYVAEPGEQGEVGFAELDFVGEGYVGVTEVGDGLVWGGVVVDGDGAVLTEGVPDDVFGVGGIAVEDDDVHGSTGVIWFVTVV